MTRSLRVRSTASAQARLSLLAEVSSRLANTLETEAISKALAELVVPRLADYCIVHAQDEHGETRSLASARVSPEQEAALLALVQHYPPQANAVLPAAHAIASGRST